MRSAELERKWLRAVAEEAGYTNPQEFIGQLDARLKKGAAEYQDSFMRRPFMALVDEAREEGVDFPAWLLLAAQRFAHAERADVPVEVADHIERVLVIAAAKALEAWHIAGMVAELLETHRPEPVGALAEGRPYETFYED